MWDKVIRSVTTRFNEFDDNVIKPKSSGKVGETEAEYNLKLRKYAEEKEKYEVYQTLLARDKELFQMRLDIFEMKRMFLEHYNQPQLVGQRPKYAPPPKVNIKMPAPIPKYQPPPKSPVDKLPPPTDGNRFPSAPMMGDVASPSSGDPFGKRKDRNNEIFRSIMNSKSQEGLNVLDDEGNPPLGDRDNDFELSGSWDDIPPTEFTGDEE